MWPKAPFISFHSLYVSEGAGYCKNFAILLAELFDSNYELFICSKRDYKNLLEVASRVFYTRRLITPIWADRYRAGALSVCFSITCLWPRQLGCSDLACDGGRHRDPEYVIHVWSGLHPVVPRCPTVKPPGQIVLTQQAQNICITFIQRRPNVSDVGPTLYKCYTNVLCLLGSPLWSRRIAFVISYR